MLVRSGQCRFTGLFKSQEHLLLSEGALPLRTLSGYGPSGPVYSVKCTVYSVQCTVYSVQCTVYCVPFTVYSLLCTVYCVQFTVYSVQIKVSSGVWTML